jgi:hypothetical protein
MQVEDIVGGSFENHGETYFNTSDHDFEVEGHEKIYKKLHESDIDHASSLCADIDNLKDKHSSLFWNIFS